MRRWRSKRPVRCVDPVEEHRRSRTTAAAEQAHSCGSLTVLVHLCASIDHTLAFFTIRSSYLRIYRLD